MLIYDMLAPGLPSLLQYYVFITFITHINLDLESLESHSHRILKFEEHIALLTARTRKLH